MKKIKVSIKTLYTGSLCEDCIEVEDNLTDDEIEEIAKEAAFNMIEWWYDEI